MSYAADVRAGNVGDDLGLSGPVVAAFESYWPAKSQVILGLSGTTTSPADRKGTSAEYSINS